MKICIKDLITYYVNKSFIDNYENQNNVIIILQSQRLWERTR